MRTRTLILFLSLALLAGACGGGSDDDGADTAAGDGATTTTTTEAAAEEPTTTTTIAVPADDTDPVADDEEPDDEPAEDPEDEEPSVLVPAPLPAVAVADLPALVVEWADATSDPLDLARRLVGFPIEIGAPDGATPYSVRVELAVRDDGSARWDWSYGSVAASGTVGEVDAELPEGGPGTIEGRLHFDPLFESYGWRNVAQVISDPSSGGGGPQSVNWAYEKNDVAFPLGAVVAEARNARAWVDEDIDFRDGDDVAGYRIDIALDAPGDVIVVPLLDALVAELPALRGARLVELDLASFDRPPDSFDAERGLRYLELEVVWSLPAGSEVAAQEAFSTGLASGVLQVGEESFFDEGFIRVAEALVDSNGTWRQPVILLDRYEGAVSVRTEDDGSVTVEFDVSLEPNREVLLPLPE